MQIVEQTRTKLVLRDRVEFWSMLILGTSYIVFGIVGGLSPINIPIINIIGLGMVILGIVILLKFLKICTYTFDKNLGYAMFKQQGLFKSKVVKYPIEMISGLEIQGNGYYQVCLVLESGKQRVPLTSYISNDEKTHQKTADAIAAFLNVRNYGFESFPDPDSEQLVLRTREEEIAHWQAVLQTNSTDADAFFNLGWALYRQDKIRNRKQVRNYVKQAIALYKAQGYEEQASQVARFWRLMSWDAVEEAYTVLKIEDGTYLKIERGTNLKVVEYTKRKLILQCLSLSSSSTCTFDKILDSVIIKNNYLLRTKVIKCSLYEVVDVQIEERTEAEEHHRYQVYRVVLVLSSGKRIPLTPFPKDVGKHPHQIIDLIQRFLSN